MLTESLNLVVLNFGAKIGKARRAVMDGREYLVASGSLINPGVLEGSKGALYYPPEECNANVSWWDNRPLTLYHPQSPDGRHVSADTEGIWESQGIGWNRKTVMNGKLQSELWFDVDLLRDPSRPYKDQRQLVYHNLISGIPIELSTGLFTDNEKAPAGANYNGRPYDFIARNYRPDHIAILPDQVGACSINDGCGVLVNAWTDAARAAAAASKKAHAASSNAIDDSHKILSRPGAKEEFIKQHRAAGDLHYAAADAHEKAGNPTEASRHWSLGDSEHSWASKIETGKPLHNAKGRAATYRSLVRAIDDLVGNDWSDAARMAAAASKAAHAASKEADESGLKKDHGRASSMHASAGFAHRLALDDAASEEERSLHQTHADRHNVEMSRHWRQFSRGGTVEAMNAAKPKPKPGCPDWGGKAPAAVVANVWSDEAREAAAASRKAHGASTTAADPTKTDTGMRGPRAVRAAGQALAAAGDRDHEIAEKAHRQIAAFHSNQAVKARENGDAAAAVNHLSAARAHGAAADAHARAGSAKGAFKPRGEMSSRAVKYEIKTSPKAAPKAGPKAPSRGMPQKSSPSPKGKKDWRSGKITLHERVENEFDGLELVLNISTEPTGNDWSDAARAAALEARHDKSMAAEAEQHEYLGQKWQGRLKEAGRSVAKYGFGKESSDAAKASANARTPLDHLRAARLHDAASGHLRDRASREIGEKYARLNDAAKAHEDAFIAHSNLAHLHGGFPFSKSWAHNQGFPPGASRGGDGAPPGDPAAKVPTGTSPAKPPVPKPGGRGTPPPAGGEQKPKTPEEMEKEKEGMRRLGKLTGNDGESEGDSDQSLRLQVTPGTGHDADSAILEGTDKSDTDLQVKPHPSHDQPRHPSTALFQGRAKNAAVNGYETHYFAGNQAMSTFDKVVDLLRNVFPGGKPNITEDEDNPTKTGGNLYQKRGQPTDKDDGAQDAGKQQEAKAKLVGTQVTHDGRIVEPVVKEGNEGFAATGTEDDHQPGRVFEFDIKAGKKVTPTGSTGWSRMVSEDNRGEAAQISPLSNEAGVPFHEILLPVTNADGSQDFVINPAVSEAQRRYLNWAFGHDWVKEHGFDNPGELPETVGDNQTTFTMKSDSPIVGCANDAEPGAGEAGAHGATKSAAVASLMSEHQDAIGHAAEAMQCSKDDDCKGAAQKHEKAAKVHEKAATDARMGGDEQEAFHHDQAAALHRKAASIHKVGAKNGKPVIGNSLTVSNIGEDSMFSEAQLEELAANCSCAETKAAIENSIKKARAAKAATPVRNKGGNDNDDDDDTEENKGEAIHSFDLKPGESKPDSGSTQAGGKGTKEEYELSGNRAIQSWMDKVGAPPELRMAFNRQMKQTRQRKIFLVNELLRGVKDGMTRNRLGNEWLQETVEHLEDRVMALNAAAPSLLATHNSHGAEREDFAVNYQGAAGGPPSYGYGGSGLTENERQDILQLPQIDYKELVAEQRQQDVRRKAN